MSKIDRSVLTTQKAKWNPTLPVMEVPNLNPTTFEYWNNNLTSVVERQKSFSGIPLDYLLHLYRVGNYKLNWPTQ